MSTQAEVKDVSNPKTLVEGKEWNLDTYHSHIGFSVKHMMVSTVRGNFTKYTAKVHFDEKHPENSTFEAVIDAASVNTGVDMRDTHLLSADFFNAEVYPELTFKSKKVESLGEGRLKVKGDLTIHGISKEVVLDGEGFTPVFKGMQGNWVTAAHAETTINRYDYDLKYNSAIEAGGVVVSEKVKIELDLELNHE